LQLNVVLILSVIAVIAGLLSGPWALESAEAAQPAITWGVIPFAFIGSAIGVFLVVVFQVLIGKQGPARFASWFFGLVGIYTATSGVSASVTAQMGVGIGPSGLFFLSGGIGIIVGALLAGAAYRAKFAT
jgi:hypothetical protein